MKTTISSKFKLPSQLGVYEEKTDPMDYLDSYKNLMTLGRGDVQCFFDYFEGVDEVMVQKAISLNH